MYKRYFILPFLICSQLWGGENRPSVSSSSTQLAKEFAPQFVAFPRDRSNWPLALNGDGDWDLENNYDHFQAESFNFAATVYFEVVEKENKVAIIYTLYNPRNPDHSPNPVTAGKNRLEEVVLYLQKGEASKLTQVLLVTKYRSWLTPYSFASNDSLVFKSYDEKWFSKGGIQSLSAQMVNFETEDRRHHNRRNSIILMNDSVGHHPVLWLSRNSSGGILKYNPQGDYEEAGKLTGNQLNPHSGIIYKLGEKGESCKTAQGGKFVSYQLLPLPPQIQLPKNSVWDELHEDPITYLDAYYSFLLKR